jgi:integrase
MATTGTGAKRANGEGSISYDAKRKRYDVRITMADGKRRKVSAATQAGAWKRAKELKSAPAPIAGLAARPNVAAWLDHWRTHVLPTTVKRSTEDGYAWMVEHYLKPQLGHHKLADLTPGNVREMLRNMERGGASSSPKAASTRRKALAVLRRALKVAERDGLVARNVAASALTDGVRLELSRARSLTPDQARQLMTEIAASDPMTEALFTLLLSTGMRKGEALGLRWSDIDTGAQTLHVRRMLARAPKQPGVAGTLYLAESTKTADSDRIVELDSLVMEALKRWRITQAEKRLAKPAMPDGLSWGLGFPSDCIFTGPLGRPIEPSLPNKLLAAMTEKLGIGHFTIHELRHSAASLMIGAGVALPTVSRMLGHSSITITMDRYGHLVSGEKRSAAAALAGVLTGGRPVSAIPG